MEPHLLAALVSKLVLCRNKLHAYNFTVSEKNNQLHIRTLYIGMLYMYKYITY